MISLDRNSAAIESFVGGICVLLNPASVLDLGEIIWRLNFLLCASVLVAAIKPITRSRSDVEYLLVSVPQENSESKK